MKKLLVTFIAVLMFSVVPTASAVTPKHRVVLPVGSTVVSWTSPEVFRHDQTTLIDLHYKGRLLRGVEVVKNCVFDFTGYGLVVRVYSCDNGKADAPLRLRVASVRSGVVKVAFRYWLP